MLCMVSHQTWVHSHNYTLITYVVRHHEPLPWTASDVWVSLEYLNPAEMTDDHGCHRSHTDMSFLVKARIAALCKSKDLVNKCSEAVKINCSYHPNSFISSATDLFNSLSTKGALYHSNQSLCIFTLMVPTNWCPIQLIVFWTQKVGKLFYMCKDYI